MFELSLQQTERVRRYVKRNDITFSHLGDDLVDHLCCDLETLMSNGIEFNDAFKRLREQVGGKELSRIQEETLYAVDLKYRNMKRLMKVSGITGTVMVGFGTLMKILHLPMAGMLLSLGALILILLLLPSSLMVLWKESKSGRRLWLYLTGFLASVLFIAGVLFKIQHWPGASIAQVAAVLAGLLLFLPAYLVKFIRDPENDLPAWLSVTGALMVTLFAAGLILKLMHWPGAAISFILSLLLLSFLFIPYYFRHNWKESAHVAPEAMFIIFVIIMFLVPATLVNLDRPRNFEAEFIRTAALNRTGNNLRIERNIKLRSEANISPEVSALAETATELLGEIDRIEAVLLPAEAEGRPVQLSENGMHPYLLNPAGVIAMIDSEPEALKLLEERFYRFIEMAGLESASQDPSGILPALISPNGTPVVPVVIIHGLEIMRGMILDTEAVALRTTAEVTQLQN